MKPAAMITELFISPALNGLPRQVRFTVALDRPLNGFDRCAMTIEVSSTLSGKAIEKKAKEKAAWKVSRQTGIAYTESDILAPSDQLGG